MRIIFSKYQATGNDFILVDNRNHHFDIDNHDLVAKLCHRRFGIGADGLILLENIPNQDFLMRFFNSDGYEGTMCGNGGRAIVAFAKSLGLIQEHTSFMAPDGVHTAVVRNQEIALTMSDVLKVETIENDYFLDTGSPHYVKIVNSLDDYDVVGEGRKIRYNSRFEKEGTNVNFVCTNGQGSEIRTYERGVEDETYACGTGAVATAIVLGLQNGEIQHKLQTKGGLLTVSYERRNNSYTEILLTGIVEKTFDGFVTLPK